MNRSSLAALLLPAFISIAGCDVDVGGIFDDQCRSDDDCPSGAICTDPFLGLQCSAAEICQTDSDCEPLQECALRDPSSGHEAVTRRTCGLRTCECDNDCPADLVCRSGHCDEAPSLCESDEECAFEQHCVTRIPPPGCWEDRMRSTCEPRPCDCDVDCPAGAVCNHGDCDAAEQTCQSETDCADVETCRARTFAPCAEPAIRTTCEPWSCSCDEQCPSGQICAGANGRDCVAGVRCASHDECPSGQQCQSVALSLCEHEQSTRMCVEP